MIANDPYLYRNCCGYKNATGDEDVTVPQTTLGSKTKKIVFTTVMLVGIVVTSNYLFKRFVK